MRQDKLAKYMFITGGVLVLPFLWIANTVYYYEEEQRKRKLSEQQETDGDGEVTDNNVHNHAPNMLDNFNISQTIDLDDSDSEDDEDDGAVDEVEFAKWRKFSAIGSLASICVFLAWNLIFHLLSSTSRDDGSVFGPAWYWMSEDEESLSSW